MAGVFPDGDVLDGAPVGVAHAVEVAQRLRAALEQGDRSVSALARDAHIARTTVQDILAGRTYPDMVTLARMEEVLEVRLWPGET